MLIGEKPCAGKERETMDSFVIDASVVFKWFARENEKYFEESRNLLYRLKNGEIALFAPNFLLTEMTNVFYWKKRFNKKEIEIFLGKIIDSGINFADCPARNAREIFALMTEYKITAYDGLYLWLAKDRNLKLISADEKLLEIKELVIPPPPLLQIV